MLKEIMEESEAIENATKGRLMVEEGTVKVDYLIGLLIKDKTRMHYKSFTAENLADEGRMIHEFLAFIKKYPDFGIIALGGTFYITFRMHKDVTISIECIIKIAGKHNFLSPERFVDFPVFI
jgi:hypothetical protein